MHAGRIPLILVFSVTAICTSSSVAGRNSTVIGEAAYKHAQRRVEIEPGRRLNLPFDQPQAMIGAIQEVLAAAKK
jgi:hypothetical protein